MDRMIIKSATDKFYDFNYSTVYKSPNNDTYYVRLFKNAGSYTSNMLIRYGWKRVSHSSLDDNFKSALKIIPIREPIERYASGIGQDYFLKNTINEHNQIIDFDNQEDINFLFNKIHFSAHTGRQTDVLDGIDTDTCIFLKVDTNYSKNLFDLLHKKFDIYIPYIKSYKKMFSNAVSNEKDKEYAKNKIERLLCQPEYYSKVINYFQEDINLWNMTTAHSIT